MNLPLFFHSPKQVLEELPGIVKPDGRIIAIERPWCSPSRSHATRRAVAGLIGRCAAIELAPLTGVKRYLQKTAPLSRIVEYPDPPFLISGICRE